MDVGGGYGRLCLTLVSQFPHLETVLFDLPEVCEKAEGLLNTFPFNLTRRIHLHPGDFFHNPLPEGADTIVMMRVMHDWPREQVKFLASKAFAALPRGGRLLIYETFKDQETCPGDAALISLLLLLISPGGECRTFADMYALLREIGFSHVELIQTVYFYSLLVAEKE
jgi:acetylserotonin N-methyltransferase